MNPVLSILYPHKQVEGNIYGLKKDCINSFTFDKGNLVFPVPEDLSVLQLVFLEHGCFRLIAPSGISFSLGANNFDEMEIHPGEQTFDCQPSFMYYPPRKQWVVLSNGSFITFDRDKEEIQQEKKSWFPFTKW
jgi:hypothetical protein